MNAAIDAGNTLVKVGLFNDGQLSQIITFPSEPIQNIYTHLLSYHFDQCIVSSVIPIPSHVLKYLELKSGLLHILNEKTRLPITNKYKLPGTLGKDRIALAVAAASRYTGKDVLCISVGTCITYNFVTANGAFMGGAISPGLKIRFQSMHDYTASLPLINIENPHPALVGNNTEVGMTSGVVNGIKFEIEGFINEIRKRHKNCAVIISGGDSRYVAEQLNIQTDIEPDLALIGLNIILKFNAPEKN